MSQVSIMPDGPNLNRTIGFVQHAVAATDLNKTEVFKEVIFPRETSFQHKETKYQEFVKLYRVERVIASHDIHPGDVIRVWEPPAYGLDLVKKYHETGGTDSPTIQRYVPLNDPGKSAEVLLLLGETYHEQTLAYLLRGIEGTTSEAAIHKALAERKMVWTKDGWVTTHPAQ